ncbi:MAG: response regulator [Candidatus Eisenbacteria bacterium]
MSELPHSRTTAIPGIDGLASPGVARDLFESMLSLATHALGAEGAFLCLPEAEPTSVFLARGVLPRHAQEWAEGVALRLEAGDTECEEDAHGPKLTAIRLSAPNAVLFGVSSRTTVEQDPARKSMYRSLAESLTIAMALARTATPTPSETTSWRVLKSRAMEVECRLPIDFEFARFVARTEKMLHTRAATKELAFQVSYDAEIPRYVRGDPSRLGQLLLSLAGHFILQATTGAVSIHFAIDDAGGGIAETLPLRVEISCTENVELPDDWELLCPQRELDLSDGPSGTRVRLHLVLQRARSAPRAAPSSAREQLEGKTILIVDDSAVSRRVCELHVRKLGCRVVTAQNGREAIDVAAAGGIDLVLMDCQMPEMDGFTATSEWRRREGAGQHLPIVALTGSDARDEEQHCRDSGMDDFLVKPFHTRELVAVLTRHLRAAA